MSALDKVQVLSDFTEAYKKANGKEPQIEAKGGWYSIDGDKNVRLAALVDLTAALADPKASGSKAAAPAKKAAPAKAVEKAPAKKAAPAKEKAPAKKKAVAKKAAPAVASVASFTVVKKGDGYNPANFWLDYLASLDMDCRTPHGFY